MTGPASLDLPGSPRRGERGSAIVEFLGGTLVLLVPILYLVFTLVQVQSAQFAATGAARDAARLVATAEPSHWGALTSASVELAFGDQGLHVVGADAATIACARTCAPGEQVAVSVRVAVPLPFAPPGIGYVAAADSWSTIDPYRVHE